MRWPWQRHRRNSSEALTHLAELDQRDPEIADLRRPLEQAERRNNFSGMVALAIHRAAQGRQ